MQPDTLQIARIVGTRSVRVRVRVRVKVDVLREFTAGCVLACG